MDSIGNTAMGVVGQVALARSRANVPALPACTTEAPVYFDRYCDIDLTRLLSAWAPDHGAREIRRALTPSERTALEVRAGALRAGLIPHHDTERDAVEAQLAAMFTGFRSMRQQNDDAEGIVSTTAAVLREFPLWAIAKSCLKVARRDAGLDPRFAPNDTEIFGVVESVVKEYRKALASAEMLLAAPIAALAPPRPLDKAEIESKLGRPIGSCHTKAKPTPVLTGDGRHMARVEADLAARRVRCEASAG